MVLVCACEFHLHTLALILFNELVLSALFGREMNRMDYVGVHYYSMFMSKVSLASFAEF